MNREERRAAATAYKEQKIPAGIYTLRCAVTDQCWVGKAVVLRSARNRLWFTLGQGVHLDAGLQAAWRQHGAISFTFDAIETIDEDLTVYARNQALKERLAFWQTELNAAVLR